MSQHANILAYFFHAGIVVKAVMLILLFASIWSWTLIIQRFWFYNRLKQQVNSFSNRFWQSTDLNRLYLELESQGGAKLGGLAAIFQAGFKELLRLRQHGVKALEPVQRAMQIRATKEASELEKHLPLFASIGNVAPFIGLFGTVWGIMASIQSLGHAQQATIAMVAPGISEALVATALGLFTAIPAVIAYNRYTTSVNGLLEQYDLFQEELIALIDQQADTHSKG